MLRACIDSSDDARLGLLSACADFSDDRRLRLAVPDLINADGVLCHRSRPITHISRPFHSYVALSLTLVDGRKQYPACSHILLPKMLAKDTPYTIKRPAKRLSLPMIHVIDGRSPQHGILNWHPEYRLARVSSAPRPRGSGDADLSPTRLGRPVPMQVLKASRLGHVFRISMSGR